jgi:hypothetical protein
MSFSYRCGQPFTYVDLLGAAAESGVVLLDKVPTNLILGNVGGRVVRLGRCGRVRGRVGGSGVTTLLYRAIAVLRDEGAVDSGFGSHCEEPRSGQERWIAGSRYDVWREKVSTAFSEAVAPERSDSGVRD